MKELIERYDELYADMATARDPKKMTTFGDAEKWMFHALAEKHPELAEKWLERLESGKWNNYLSEEEARKIVENLKERHGDVVTRRHEWNYEVFKNAVESMGGETSMAPYYNCYALWAVMNMLFSDHVETVNMFVQPNMRVKYYYHMAVDKLKDVDRPHFVREYFHLE